MDALLPISISILLAVGLGCELAVGQPSPSAQSQAQSPAQATGLQGRLLDRCCQVGRERAIESGRFNCKLSAREALLSTTTTTTNPISQQQHLELVLARDPNFGDQCEMVLESCCLALHRTRNCNSGKQFAKSGSACMDVELSKEASVATESFNDCCMSCSLGILAARTPAHQNDSTTPPRLSDRCKLISPLASSLSGQLYEQTYDECCQENLPRPSSALNFEPGARVDCSQAANVCSQRCLPAGSLDQVTRRQLEQDKCDCFAGFKLATDGVSCLDVDECELNLHTCNRHSEVCDNTRGSFRCLARAHEQHQFASMRLCPPNSRWLAAEARCQPNIAAGELNWKRNAAAFASHSSVSSSPSSSRRSARSD